MPWRSHRLAEKASWTVDIYDSGPAAPSIFGLALADERLFVAGSEGELRVVSADDGRLLTQRPIPAPLWDGLAIAYGRLYLSTADGRLLCLGAK